MLGPNRILSEKPTKHRKHMSLRIKILTALALLMATTSAAQKESGEATQIIKGRLQTECAHPGIKRVRTYDISSTDIPKDFDGFRILFVADTHYPSLFTTTTLHSLGAVIDEIAPDAMLLGGDYQEGCDYVAPLFDTMMRKRPRYGTYAVLGNNDLERCTDTIKTLMSSHGITLVEDTSVMIRKGMSHIVVAGVHNSFKGSEEAISPTLRQKADDFVILLTHTPDYAEDQDITNADVTLAGHTHGGQVTLFGAFAPITGSRYGQRFLKGLNYNTAGQPVITTTGIGTSRRAVRLFAPSEVILITLHSWNHSNKLSDPYGDEKVTAPLSKPLVIKPTPRPQETIEMPKKL